VEFDMRNDVLFVCEGRQHLTSATVLAKHLEKVGIKPLLYYPHAIPEEPALHVFKHMSNDIFVLPGILQWVGLVVFFTNESSPFCMVSNKIGFIAKRTGTPTVTVQHGWIQPGLNYSADLPKVGFTGRGTDNSPALWHFSPVLKFFGEDGIGYPNAGSNAPIKISKNKAINALISTNFNWNVYSRESIVAFLRALIATKENFPFINFLHRAHPAENPESISAELGFYMDILGATSGSWPDIGSALDWADVVISTPSTVVLDAYYKGVPSFVYKPPGFENSLAQAEGITFSNGNELTSMMGALLTEGKYSDPKFPGFNPDRFEAVVREMISNAKPFNLQEEDYLQFVSFCKL
jgi:hypothetical protein